MSGKRSGLNLCSWGEIVVRRVELEVWKVEDSTPKLGIEEKREREMMFVCNWKINDNNNNNERL